MIALVATLVERSRGPDFRLHLSPKDYNAIAGGKVMIIVARCFLFYNVLLFPGVSFLVSANKG